jgi:hypothetical protein
VNHEPSFGHDAEMDRAIENLPRVLAEEARERNYQQEAIRAAVQLMKDQKSDLRKTINRKFMMYGQVTPIIKAMQDEEIQLAIHIATLEAMLP